MLCCRNRVRFIFQFITGKLLGGGALISRHFAGVSFHCNFSHALLKILLGFITLLIKSAHERHPHLAFKLQYFIVGIDLTFRDA